MHIRPPYIPSVLCHWFRSLGVPVHSKVTRRDMQIKYYSMAVYFKAQQYRTLAWAEFIQQKKRVENVAMKNMEWDEITASVCPLWTWTMITEPDGISETYLSEVQSSCMRPKGSQEREVKNAPDLQLQWWKSRSLHRDFFQMWVPITQSEYCQWVWLKWCARRKTIFQVINSDACSLCLLFSDSFSPPAATNTRQGSQVVLYFHKKLSQTSISMFHSMWFYSRTTEMIIKVIKRTVMNVKNKI